MFAVPTTEPFIAEPTRFRTSSKVNYAPKYVNPNNMEETFPTDLHATVVAISPA